MGNTSTIDYDNECYDNLVIDDIDFIIDCYIEKRWFIFKLTKEYELLIYEIIKYDLLDVEYFDLEYPLQEYKLELTTELHTSSTTIHEKIVIRKCVLRRTESTDLTNQIVFLTDLIDKKTYPNKEDLQKYLDILIFFQKNIV